RSRAGGGLLARQSRLQLPLRRERRTCEFLGEVVADDRNADRPVDRVAQLYRQTQGGGALRRDVPRRVSLRVEQMVFRRAIGFPVRQAGAVAGAAVLARR